MDESDNAVWRSVWRPAMAGPRNRPEPGSTRSSGLKQWEKENTRLKKLVADQASDMAILKEVAEGKW